MITERMLRKWRKEALNTAALTISTTVDNSDVYIKILSERILKMTQELLDLHLLRREK